MPTRLILLFGFSAWSGVALASTSPLRAAIFFFICVVFAWFRRSALSMSLAIAAAFAGWAQLVDGWNAAIVGQIPAGPVRLQGVVAGAASLVEAEAPWMRVHAGAKRKRFLLQVDAVEGSPVSGVRVKVVVPEEVSVVVGERLEIMGSVRKGLPKQWALDVDGAAMERRLRLGGTLSVPAAALVRHVATASATEAALWSWPVALRVALAERLGGSEGAAVARAIVVGDRSALTHRTTELLADAGIVHVLSVSGLHTAAVSVCVFTLLRLLFGLALPWFAFSARRAAALASLPLVALYVVVSGAEAPALRSMWMGGLLGIALVCGVRSAAQRVYALSLLLMLAWAPEDGRDPGFVLSFIGMAALLIWLPRLRAGRIATLFLASALPMLASAPFTLGWFHRVATFGVVLNVVAVPVSSLLVVCGLPWLLFGWQWLGDALLWLGDALLWLAKLTPPASVLHLSLWSHEQLIVFAAIVLVATRRRFVFPCVTMCALVLAAPALVRHASADVWLHTLPVGQGDGHVLFLPGGRTVVIDGGGQHDGAIDPGARVMAPFLSAWRVRSIDTMILTHAHPDHFGGLVAVAERTRVERFVWNGQEGGGQGMARLLARVPPASALAVPELRVLHPIGEDYFEELSLNDNSLVTLLSFAGRRVLLGADAERFAEDSLVPTLPVVDVLKVSHHGSHTSTSAELLARAQPQHALISAGIGNSFGHPHALVLDRLRAAGVTVWRTDRCGHLCTHISAGGALDIDGYLTPPADGVCSPPCALGSQL